MEKRNKLQRQPNHQVFTVAFWLLVIGFAVSIANAEQLKIQVKKESSLMTEKRIVDLTQDNRLKVSRPDEKLRISLGATATNLSGLTTSANTYESEFFSDGIVFARLGLNRATESWTYGASVGWTDDQKLSQSPLFGPANSRAHLIPLSLDFHYVIPQRYEKWSPAMGLNVHSFFLVQRSESPDAETSEVFFFLEPSLRSDYEVRKNLWLSFGVGYLSPIVDTTIQTEGLSASMGLLFAL